MRRMRILLSIAESVVHTVKDRVSPGAQVRRTLGDISEEVKEPLPKLVHCEHFMGRVTMQEKSLAK